MKFQKIKKIFQTIMKAFCTCLRQDDGLPLALNFPVERADRQFAKKYISSSKKAVNRLLSIQRIILCMTKPQMKLQMSRMSF